MNSKLLFTIVMGISYSSLASAQLTDQEIRNFKGGRVKPDTSFVYSLPYQAGKRILFVQGANSKMSHKDELSFDFKMKKGTPICAARAGKVIEVKRDSKEGGLDPKFYNSGNHIIIEHKDGSRAMYWHLDYQGTQIKKGDMVHQNQPIGHSGNTGYSAFPHLHFQVIDKNGQEILPRFKTHKEVRYLRPGRWYKSK